MDVLALQWVDIFQREAQTQFKLRLGSCDHGSGLPGFEDWANERKFGLLNSTSTILTAYPLATISCLTFYALLIALAIPRSRSAHSLDGSPTAHHPRG